MAGGGGRCFAVLARNADGGFRDVFPETSQTLEWVSEGVPRRRQLGGPGGGPPPSTLLGLYEGVPLTSRGAQEPYLPDRICIFRRPIERMSVSPRRQAAIVRDTVVHEIAHHFGISDRRLHELGLGDAD